MCCIQEEAVLRGQELENAISDADYTKAIQLAFELRRSHKLFELFSQLCRSVVVLYSGLAFLLFFFGFSLHRLCRKDAANPLEKSLLNLGKDELRVLLEYVREWNTKPKLCHVANFVLSRVFKLFPPTKIIEVMKYTPL